MSFFLFTKSKLKPEQRGKKKVLRNRIYRICGVTITLAILAVFICFKLYPEWCHKSSFTFWMEAIAVEFFGISWMVKGDAFAYFRDKDENLVQFSKIQHVGIPVANLEISTTFYKGLGFADVMNATFIHHGDEGKVAMMKRGSVTIEIYQMPEPELTEVKNRKNGHIDHIAFDVKDIEKVYATLKAQNYKIIEAAPVFLPFWENGCKYFNIEGPDGERLEFNEIL
jgi:lactoylglutathione lyase